jgi:NAD(P)-dependent dehydrogenase (short-subunit alcohol dehydrogenase family)
VELSARRGNGREGGTVLVLVEDADPVGAAVAERLRATGRDVRVLRRGAAWSEDAAGWVIRAGDHEDHEQVASALRDCGGVDQIVWMWGAASECAAEQMAQEATQLAEGCAALLRTCAAHGLLEADVRLLAVTRNVAEVVGGEHLRPWAAPIWGIARVLSREHSRVASTVLDVDDAALSDPVALADVVAAELDAQTDDETLAYRNGQRWIHGYEQARVERASAPLLPDGGVVLITGGTGGIGLAIAEHLCERVAHPTIVLAGRSGLPPRDGWDTWCAEHDHDDPDVRRIRRVRAMEETGATLVVEQADMAERSQVEQLVERVVREHGGPSLVLHAAGVPGGGLLRTTSSGQMARVLAPKVAGTLNLLGVLHDHGLAGERVLLFSSLNTIDPRLGVADYTAANCFVDAVAGWARQAGWPRVTAVNWTGWRDIGMAIDGGAPTTAEAGIELPSLLSDAALASHMSRAEALDSLERVAALDLPQIAISTQDLDTVVRVGRTITLETALEHLAEDALERIHERPDTGVEFVAPRDRIEQAICDTLQLLLGVDRVGVTDDFFELGGHSLLAIDLLARMRTQFDCELPLRSFLEQPRAEILASHIKAHVDALAGAGA